MSVSVFWKSGGIVDSNWLSGTRIGPGTSQENAVVICTLAFTAIHVCQRSTINDRSERVNRLPCICRFGHGIEAPERASGGVFPGRFGGALRVVSFRVDGTFRLDPEPVSFFPLHYTLRPEFLLAVRRNRQVCLASCFLLCVTISPWA
jgi:hypothetical protein